MTMSLTKDNSIYEECASIKKTEMDDKIGESIIKEIGSNFRTLPSFEKSLYEHVFIRHYSLERNERLKCRWIKYKQNVDSRVFAPFQFPAIRDLHIRNNVIEFIPSENKYKFDNRMKLKPGPGVDAVGQLPIPQELLMKRGGVKKDINKVDKDGRNKKRIRNRT